MNLILFMMAGYETTSTTLAYCMHVLAKYPHEQQKLVDEINSYLEGVPDVINLYIDQESSYAVK